MSVFSRPIVLLAVLLASLYAGTAVSSPFYDPPGRVARLSDVRGDVVYSPAGDNRWYSVHRNRPLIRGDRLWADRGARAEVQVGSSAIRLDSNTSLEFLELNDRFVQLEVTEGSVNLRVRRMYPGQEIEIATPSLAFVIRQPGSYRIDVDVDYDTTTIAVARGAGIAYGEGDRFPVRAGDAVVFYGYDLRDYEIYALPRMDDFDRYAAYRDRRLDRSQSLRYLSDDVVGYSDLDDYGSWRPVPSYGNVWFPNQVGANWAPYSDGQWVWQEPWGWTWIDNADWGFAPSHYGRWINTGGRWGWIPGPRNYRPVYAPALVVFIGDRGWNLSIGLGGDVTIGWFPLGPHDVYIPPYQASRDYYSQVNISNTVINNITINQTYNSYSNGTVNPSRINYVNQAVPTAVTAVPARAFTESRPVREAAVRFDRNALSTGQLSRLAPIAPSERSLQGPATAARVQPPRDTEQRQVFVRTAPPPPAPAFAERERQLSQRPGQPVQPNVEPRPRAAVEPGNFRVLRDNASAVDARAAGPRRARDTTAPAAPTNAPVPATAPAVAPMPATPAVPPPLDRQRPGRRPRVNDQAVPEASRDQPRPMTPPAAAPPEPTIEQRQAEARARADAAAQARAEEQAKARADVQAQRDAQAQADAKARADAEAQARAVEAAKARADEQAKARADAQAQREAQAQAEARAKADAEGQAAAADAAKARADAQAQRDAAAQARAEEQAKARADAQAQREAQAQADAKAKADAEAQAQAPVQGEANIPESSQQQAARAAREARRAARERANRNPPNCLTPEEVAALKQQAAASGEAVPAYVDCAPEQN